MPSITIHIAIGKEYIRKHRGEIKNENDFLKGTIMPDLNESMTEIIPQKNITHFSKEHKNEINIDLFLKDKEVNLDNDYWKGYLLHLLTDDYFYNVYFKKEYEVVVNNNDNFYYDADCLNSILMPKYKIKEISTLKKYMTIDKNKTEPKYLKEDKVIDFIEKMSDIDLKKEIENLKKGME